MNYSDESLIRAKLRALHDDIVAAIDEKNYDAVDDFARRAALLRNTLRAMNAAAVAPTLGRA
jgi:hypothetical protein